MTEFLLFPAGIGLFLFALQKLESAVAELYSDHLKEWLRNFTSSPARGILLGTFATAILQSSSVVGLMTLAFIGAGVIELRNALGIILGSILGTTFTGWVVTVLGFKLELTAFAGPMMGFSAIGIVMLSSESRNYLYSQLIFAFGLLLMGLAMMNEGISMVVESVDVTILQALPLIFYFGFGILLTAVIQSSSATMMITLSALSAGVLDFMFAAALVTGASVGTSSTVIIGALKGTSVKKQMALAHTLIHLVVGVLAFLSLPLLNHLIVTVVGISDPLFQLVTLHSTFNLVGILLFFPFLGKVQVMVEKRFPVREQGLLLIDRVSPEVPDAAFSALEKDVANLLQSAVLLNAWRLGILPETVNERQVMLTPSVDTSYTELKFHENRLSDYILELQRQPFSLEQSVRAQQLMVCVRDTLYATKAVKDIFHDIRLFQQSYNRQPARIPERLLGDTEDIYRRLLKAVKEPESFTIDQFSALVNDAKRTHAALNAIIYELIDSKDLQKDRASTALNINREMLLSSYSLINALEHFLLPGDQARTVSELLSLRP